MFWIRILCVKNQINKTTNLIKCTSWHDVPLAFTWSNVHGFPDDISNCTIWHEAGMFEISTSHNSLVVDSKKQCSSFAKLKPTFEHFSSYSKFVVIVHTKHRMTTAEKDTYRLQSTSNKFCKFEFSKNINAKFCKKKMKKVWIWLKFNVVRLQSYMQK